VIVEDDGFTRRRADESERRRHETVLGRRRFDLPATE